MVNEGVPGKGGCRLHQTAPVHDYEFSDTMLDKSPSVCRIISAMNFAKKVRFEDRIVVRLSDERWGLGQREYLD